MFRFSSLSPFFLFLPILFLPCYLYSITSRFAFTEKLEQARKRSSARVVDRCLVCLDADNADRELLDDLDMTFINAYALYSTHSHTPEKMRLRLIIPLTRTVTPDEYAAVSRRIADDLTLSRFDPTTCLLYTSNRSNRNEIRSFCVTILEGYKNRVAISASYGERYMAFTAFL